MAVAEGRVGPQTANDGATLIERMLRDGSVAVADAHSRYFELTARKQIFSGAIVGQVTSVALATTYTGLCLSNPIGSGQLLVLNKLGYGFLVAFAAAAAVGLMVGYHASTDVVHTTPVIPRNNFIGGAAGVGKLDSACTLPVAPTVQQILESGLTGAITTAPSGGAGFFDNEGSLIIPPGGFVAYYTSTASGAAGSAFSFQWSEVPIGMAT